MSLYSKIIGTGAALPARRVTNRELAETLALRGVETSDDWIVTRSGISSRHFAATGEMTSDLAAAAARRAIAASDLQAENLDLIVLATSTPDHIGGFPSTACVVQHKLGIGNNGAAVDVQAVCTGFAYALVMADAMIRSGAHRNALVIGAEVFSRIIDFNDRSTCVLFGDGAGAVVLSASDHPGLLASRLHADGSQADVLKIQGNVSNGVIDGSPYLYMEGSTVFKLGVKVMADVIMETLAHQSMPVQDLDWLILHQANIRILHAVAKHIALPHHKLIVTLQTHGNTSAASIPLALDAAVRDGRIVKGQRIMMAAVGGGLTWGAVLAQL
jgi:3-oxoacyl-[acyl-carrier-protein] synthase-3